jgi:hypothetical protein
MGGMVLPALGATAGFLLAPASGGTSLALMGAGMGAMAGSTIQTGIVSSESANYQAQVARNNQQIAQQNANYATQRGNVMVQQKQQQTAQAEGNIRAAAGASGIDVNSGSSVRLQSDTAKLGTFDALTIRNAAAREAYGYNTQGMSYQAQASLDQYEATADLEGGFLKGMGSMVASAGQVNSKWGQMFSDPSSVAGTAPAYVDAPG